MVYYHLPTSPVWYISIWKKTAEKISSISSVPCTPFEAQHVRSCNWTNCIVYSDLSVTVFLIISHKSSTLLSYLIPSGTGYSYWINNAPIALWCCFVDLAPFVVQFVARSKVQHNVLYWIEGIHTHLSLIQQKYFLPLHPLLLKCAFVLRNGNTRRITIIAKSNQNQNYTKIS